MHNRVITYIRRHGLLRPGARVLVAVSGGADSVALLCALHQIAASLEITLHVAHMNHCIRGKEADADAAFVKKLAAQLKLQFTCGRINVPALAKRGAVSIEMAARTARYDFFARTARKVTADLVATAHTADDQAETVLLKLARGAGPRGLAGISRKIAINGLTIVRPLLETRRSEIEAFLRSCSQTWREDKTNLDSVYLRNRVRHEVLPFLETKLNPDIRTALTRTADLLREEDNWLEELSAKILAKCAEGSGLLIPALKPECLAARRRVLRQWLSAAGVPPEVIDFDVIARVGLLLETDGSGSTELAGNWIVKRRYDHLVVEQGQAEGSEAFRCEVKVPGETVLAGQLLRIETALKPGLVKEQGRIGQYPARGSIRLPAGGKRTVIVRSWQPGDRMKPFGMAGSKKLHDIFIDAKVPVEERGCIPVFECAGEIIWIPGYRVAKGWEVRNPADPALQVEVHRSV